MAGLGGVKLKRSRFRTFEGDSTRVVSKSIGKSIGTFVSLVDKA